MLKEYTRKRDFKKTPEPKGAKAVVKPKKALRFVVQKHAASHLHFDFRLELDGVLLSWAVPKGPSYNPKDKRLAIQTEDHPLDYQNFEGIIPKGEYGGGAVIIWDKGVYLPHGAADVKTALPILRQGLKKGKLSFEILGEKLEGSWSLIRIHGKEKEWLLLKSQDKYADPKLDIAADDTSVVSGRTLEELKRGNAKAKKRKKAA